MAKKSMKLHLIADRKLIHDLDETKKVLKEVTRLLKLNGKLLVKRLNRSFNIVQ